MMPIVSVILPVRNGGRYIRAAVESILLQEGVDFELIVIDDGSSDGTRDYLGSLEDPRLRILCGGGRGLVSALNAGISAANGPFIARMDADDISLPGRLANQASILSEDGDAMVLYTSVYVIDENGRRTGRFNAKSMALEERRAVLLGETRGTPIIHPSVMMRRTLLEAVGGYRESPVAEDHELWLRTIDSYKFRAIEEPLLEYRHFGGGVSRTRSVEQSLSNLMNSACFRIKAETGKDLQGHAPELYKSLRSWAFGELGEMLGLIARSRHIRSELKRGDRLAAIKGMVSFPKRHLILLYLPFIHAWLLRAQHRIKQHGIEMMKDAGM